MKINSLLTRKVCHKKVKKAFRVMKITFLLILMFASNLFAINSEAQNAVVEFRSNSLSIEDLFKEIEQQTDYLIVYSTSEIDSNFKVTLSKKKAKVAEILDEVLGSRDLKYEFSDNYIVLSRSARAEGTQQAKRLVSGIIKDEEGNPIIGANVVEKGTANGTITDIDGRFSLHVSDNAILAVSYVGYKEQQANVGNRSKMEIVLQEDAEALDEVVVVGYGVMKKKDLTGAVSSVNNKTLTKASVPDIGGAIQGRAAGVQVVNAGKPGDGVSLKIRGLGTVNNSDPLIVIDGVPTELGLGGVNMEDVETVDILKDASATAIYGSRGANGVVMITTKKGKSGEGVLSVRANVSIQNATNMPKMLNASQYAQLNNEMMANAGKEQNPDWATPSTLGEGTDWVDELIDTSLMQNYTLSYSGGSDKSNYYVSMGLQDQQGIVRNTSARRYTVQFNGEQRVKSWIKFSNRLTLNHSDNKSGNFSVRETMASLPTNPLIDEDGNWGGPVGRPEWVGDLTNWIGHSEIDKNQSKGYNVLGNLSAEITFFKGFSFKTTAGIEAKFWNDYSFTPAYDWKPTPTAQSSRYDKSWKSITYLWDNFFTYINSFGDHSINLMAGTSAQNQEYTYLTGTKENFNRDQTNQMDNALTVKALGGNASEWALLSFMARANYSYANKYLATVTVRRDGSSRFGQGHKWGTFPSFSGAWRISEESWFKKSNFLSDLKLRAGFGITGNQNIGNNYGFASVYKTGSYNFGTTTVPTLVADRMPNPDITWEEVQQTNVGVDASLLSQRINLSVDVYWKNTNDMLVPMIVPVSSGYSYWDVPSINAGSVLNKGFEITLNTQNLKGEFEWNTSFNVSYNTNEIKSLNGDTPLYQNSLDMFGNITKQAVGHPINSFFGYVMDGIFQNEEEVKQHATQIQGGTAAGDIRFKNLNGDDVINDEDRDYIGNPTPKWMFAMSNDFYWKGFDLSIFFQGVAGNKIFNANRIWWEGMSLPQNQTVATLDRWTGEGTSNEMPRAIYGDPNKNTRISDRYVENGSYLRLKNLTLGYTLPKAITRKFMVEDLRFFFTGQNLLTITGYSGFDPEVGINGIDNSVYPITRNYTFGLSLNF